MTWDALSISLLVFLCIFSLILLIIFCYWLKGIIAYYKSYNYEIFVHDVKSNLYNIYDLERGAYGYKLTNYWNKFKRSDFKQWQEEIRNINKDLNDIKRKNDKKRRK